MFNISSIFSTVVSSIFSSPSPAAAAPVRRRKMTFVEYDESQSWALDEWIQIEESPCSYEEELRGRATRESIVRSEGTLRAAGRRMAAHRPKGYVHVSYSPVDCAARSRGYHL